MEVCVVEASNRGEDFSARVVSHSGFTVTGATIWVDAVVAVLGDHKYLTALA